MAKKKADEKKATPKKKKKTAKKKADEKPASGKLAQMASALDKAFKDKAGKVTLDTNALKKSLPHIPTGSMVIDWLIGGQPNANGVAPCPGLPKGRLFNLYGMESSGKTTLALTTAATTIAAGGTVAMIDWEHAIDLRYAQALGVPQDPEKFYLAQPTDLETGLGICYYLAKNGVDLIILDSIGAGVPKKIMAQKLEEIGQTGRVGLMSTIWGIFLPKLKEAITKSGTVVIGISQLRDKINTSGFGASGGKHAQGGNSWKFYSDLRIMLRCVSREKGETYSAIDNKAVERVIGSTIEAKLDKIKVAPNQGATAEFFIRYGEGIDDVRSILGIASAHGIVVKSGSWFTWEREDGELKAQGAENFRSVLLSTPGAWEKLYQTTLRRMSEASRHGIVEEEPDPDEVDLSDIGFDT